mgnify:CR=1 FL=1
MSKIGKKNIIIPKDSSVKIEGSNLTITGPKGTKKLTINDKIFSSQLKESELQIKPLEKNIDKILPLYDLTLHARKLLEREEYKEFVKCISENWNIKKSTSKYITQNKKVRDLDEFCEKRDQILAHKLLGAGNGGFFLVVTRKNEPLTSNIFNVILRNA